MGCAAPCRHLSPPTPGHPFARKNGLRGDLSASLTPTLIHASERVSKRGENRQGSRKGVRSGSGVISETTPALSYRYNLSEGAGYALDAYMYGG